MKRRSVGNKKKLKKHTGQIRRDLILRILIWLILNIWK